MTLLVNDTALRNAFRAGETAALTKVYTEYARSLFAMLHKGFPVESGGKRFMFRGYKEPWRLENAVQEIFARAFTESARGAYDGLRPYKNYLMTIARNYVVDGFRKDLKERAVLDDLPEYRMAELPDSPHAEDPEAAAITRRLKEETAKFTDGLDRDDRALFDARFVEGRSVESCSEYLNISEYRVKRDEKRIRKAFFVFMRQRGFFEGYNYLITSMVVLLLSGAGLYNLLGGVSG